MFIHSEEHQKYSETAGFVCGQNQSEKLKGTLDTTDRQKVNTKSLVKKLSDELGE